MLDLLMIAITVVFFVAVPRLRRRVRATLITPRLLRCSSRRMQ